MLRPLPHVLASSKRHGVWPAGLTATVSHLLTPGPRLPFLSPGSPGTLLLGSSSEPDFSPHTRSHLSPLHPRPPLPHPDTQASTLVFLLPPPTWPLRQVFSLHTSPAALQKETDVLYMCTGRHSLVCGSPSPAPSFPSLCAQPHCPPLSPQLPQASSATGPLYCGSSSPSVFPCAVPFNLPLRLLRLPVTRPRLWSSSFVSLRHLPAVILQLFMCFLTNICPSLQTVSPTKAGLSHICSSLRTQCRVGLQ